MPTPVLQPTFTGGELSPSLYARVDLARYGTSLKTAKNFIVRPYGGVVNRPGLEFVGEAKDSTKSIRLLPFEFSSEVAYVIELGDEYMRFIYQGAYVVDGLGAPFEIATPWTEDERREVSITQSADVLYVAHPSYQPIEVRRLTASTFEARLFANKNGPFAPINSDEARKIAVSDELGSVTVTSSAEIFTADMVGSLIYVEEKDIRSQRPWEPGWRNPFIGQLCRSDSKVYAATNRAATPPGGWVQTGGQRPIHDSGRAYDGPQDVRSTGSTDYSVGVEWEYQHSGYGIVQITSFTSATSVGGIVTSRIPASCVGGLGASTTTWNLVGDGATKVFAIAAASSDSNADYTVTFDGVPVQPDPFYTPPNGLGGGGNQGTGGSGTIYVP